MTDISMMATHNPYPAWQQLAGDSCCWRCYIMLLTAKQVKAHLCDTCKSEGYYAVSLEEGA